MPTYDFKCYECGNVREVNIKHSEYSNYKVKCTNGHYLKMERVYSVPAVKFNGSGFYSTGG